MISYICAQNNKDGNCMKIKHIIFCGAMLLAKGAKDGVFDKLKNIGSEIKGIIQGIMDALDPKIFEGEEL